MCEPAASTCILTHKKPSEIFNLGVIVTKPKQKETLGEKIDRLKVCGWNLVPSGWIYQNFLHYRILSDDVHASLFDEHKLVTPKKADNAAHLVEEKLKRPGLFDLLATVAIPNYSMALRTFAYNQTLANEAQIACALERWRLAHGNYPESLAALVPQFTEKLPPDLIGGQPLHYRRTEDWKFLLYSVGWNETDAGGITVKDKSGNVDKTKGDWVWQ